MYMFQLLKNITFLARPLQTLNLPYLIPERDRRCSAVMYVCSFDWIVGGDVQQISYNYIMQRRRPIAYCFFIDSATANFLPIWVVITELTLRKCLINHLPESLFYQITDYFSLFGFGNYFLQFSEQLMLLKDCLHDNNIPVITFCGSQPTKVITIKKYI